ncbi:putative DNA repair protein YkoV [compost metagenome]
MAGSIWKGSISFGLLNIPVTLQSAELDKGVHFSLLDKKDMSRIKYQKISASTGKEVPFDRIVKGYQYESGRFVVLSDADIKKANVKATQTIDIEDFVLMDEVDPLLFDRPYYLVPQKGAEKGYFLLRDALLKTSKVAIAKIVIRVKQHLVMILPKGEYLVLELLRFSHQVKSAKELDYLKEVGAKGRFNSRELKMAEDLIAGMTTKWKPEKYRDTYYNDVMKMIKSRVRQGKGKVAVEPAKEEKITPTSNIIDLMPLLKQSLAAQKGKKKPRAASAGGKRGA